MKNIIIVTMLLLCLISLIGAVVSMYQNHIGAALANLIVAAVWIGMVKTIEE